MSSPFLAVPPSEWVASNELAFAIRDRHPVAPGHTLVVPRRPVATWFDASVAEQGAMMALVDVVKVSLDAALAPDGYNVGWNVGAAAGQTVFHLHVHVIPRRAGDVADPTGGVRNVIPGRGNYLSRRPLWIMVAGPYSSGAADAAGRAANLAALNRAALALARAGHVPVVGVNAALPLIDLAAEPAAYDELMMPISLALADRCDACLRFGGPSDGADAEAARFRAAGKPVYLALADVPPAR
jgi:diadenosine tetraphosphate (Ap4A) HIT family hydrolase